MTARGTVKLLVRSCRTVDEGRRVQAELKKHGLRRGEDGIEVNLMCEITSNVLLADGFAIGTNDLAQPILDVDPDSEIVAPIFDERNAAVKKVIARVIHKAREKGRKIGICRTRNRQHLAQSGHGAQDDRGDLGKGKRNQSKVVNFPTLLGIIAIALAPLPRASSHCDGLDGPVVPAARKALETGNVKLVLICVQKSDEAEIKWAFDHAQTVRKLSAEARELADRYCFDTLVRTHRAAEGAPFTGLKPAGRDVGPAIPAADAMLRDENVDRVLKLLTDSLERGVREHFERALVAKDFDKDDVDAGRNFVKAYVEYIHCVEALYRQATSPCTVITTKKSRRPRA